MKIKDGFMIREVGGAYVVVPVGERSVQFNGMVNLNEIGAFIWKVLEKGAEKQDVIDAILEEYDVTRETAEKDADQFINVLKENNILEM